MSVSSDIRHSFHVPATIGWLLLEDAGPWDFQIPAGPLLPAQVLTEARSRHVRVNLIRHRHPVRTGDGQRCFLISSVDDRQFVEQWVRADLYRRLPQALDAIIGGVPTGGGVPVTHPMYLVCTNGQRNPACGRQSLGVQRALTDLVGARAWDTTHVGGCYLAVNLVCLPTGVVYSRVTPDDVPAIVAATERGRIALPRYRGRAGVPANVQTAELAVRRATGLDTVGGARPVATESGGNRVSVATDDGVYRVTLRRKPDGWLDHEVVGMTLLPAP